MNATEIECPICDMKVQSDIMSCPNCGANLSMSSFADLEEVARKLATPVVQEPPKVKDEPKEPEPSADPKIEVKKLESSPTDEKEEPKAPAETKIEEKTTPEPIKDQSKRGLGRLFGKKKK